MVKLNELSSDGKIAYLINPILTALQEAGGQLERSEIKERIADMDDQVAEFSAAVSTSKKTGNTYKEFEYKFNFAIKNLLIAGMLTYVDTSPITLTEKGLYLNIESLNAERDILNVTKPYWKELSKKNKSKR